MAGARGGGKNAFPTNGGTGGASRPQCVSSHPGEQTVTGRDRELPVSTRGPRTQGRGLEWQGKVHKKPGRKAKTAGSREVHFPAQQRRDDEDVGGDSGQSGSAGRPEALLMPRPRSAEGTRAGGSRRRRWGPAAAPPARGQGTLRSARP